MACVWPDTGRLERTAASIRLAQDDPPTVIAGDAIDTLPGVLADLPADSVAIVVTTSAFAYLSIEERGRFEASLAAESRRRSVAWLSAEGAGIVGALAGPATADRHHADADVLGAVTFDGGESSAHFLGFAHNHGLWIDWRAGDPGDPAGGDRSIA